MIGKMLKVMIISFSAIVIVFTLLYALAPYLIKYGMDGGDIRANPGKYEGLDALPENGRILFVTAHPDDLEFMAGGTLPKLIERNNDVYMAILTDGGKQRYMPGFYSRLIVKTRHEEQLATAEIQGLKEVFFINYPDGSLKFSEPAVGKVKQVADEVKATHIFTFEPAKRENNNGLGQDEVHQVGAGNGDGPKVRPSMSGDHDAAGQIGTAVAKRNASVEGLYYFRAENPDIIIDISDTFDKKLDILLMFTEFKYKKRMIRAFHEAWDSSNGRRIGVGYAEVFRRIDLRTRPVEPVEVGFTGERTN
ncbi:MAG: PIG-L family deacetylase [Actinobacteria bacterium]|nr:PIG-L family deacetylase [Actinomycetota bacterium]